MSSDGAVKNHAAFIWSVADLLRGDYKQSEYGKVILPLTVVRRLDCVLEPTKEAVLKRQAELAGRIENLEPVLEAAAGEQFSSNTSPLDFRRLLDDPTNLADNLRAGHIGGFSSGAKDVIEKFDFNVQIDRLDRSNLLFLVIAKFADIDLHPDAVSNLEMGYLYEELVRRFSELSNETAGEHFTPREVIRLMMNLLFIEDEDILTRPGIVKTLFDPACGTGGMLSVAEDHLRSMNPGARLEVFGQELNAETYAICRSDMMLKGQDTPQATTSALRLSRRGAPSLAPAMSAARTAKPSTLERSNGGASTGAMTLAASTRASASASGTDFPSSGERSIPAAKRRRASAADNHFEELLLPGGATHRLNDRRAVPVGRGPRWRVEICIGCFISRIHGHDPTATGVPAAKSFAVGRNDDPSVAPRQRLRCQIAGRQRLRHAAAAGDGIEFHNSDCGRDFPPQRQHSRHRFDMAAGEPRDEMAADEKPDRQCGIETARNEQDRPRADEPEGRRFAGRHRDTVNIDSAQLGKRIHRAIMPAAAGAADGIIASACGSAIAALSMIGPVWTEAPASKMAR